MPISVVRFTAKNTDPSKANWGVLFGEIIAPLSEPYTTTGDFIEHGLTLARTLQPTDATIRVNDVSILSPITRNQQFLCQGVNYRSHVKESGLNPANFPFNTFFTKSSQCISGPYDDVIRPAHVKLLDYEIELGLVMKKSLTTHQSITDADLPTVLAGITIVNDVSARDVQLPQGQFYKGKSYRTFGPVGPILLLLEPHEWALLPNLRMTLKVNGSVRQDDVCGSMIHSPSATLTELSGLHDLQAGDLIATGTPAGCAAKAPGKAAMFLAKHFLSEPLKWKLFVQKGLKNPLYLQPTDQMELQIRTPDSHLDLGVQRNKIVSA